MMKREAGGRADAQVQVHPEAAAVAADLAIAPRVTEYDPQLPQLRQPSFAP